MTKRTTRISGGGGGGGDGEVKRTEAPPAHRLPHPSSQPSLDDPEEKHETGIKSLPPPYLGKNAVAADEVTAHWL
ncbi:hypothetical protein C0Q70_00569 [Pomacea canaliculata]|uniref:Uncharacterized protein n=1 Tax=Pomacea canaliculata TaxID=400727 RepID=A0A2T7PX56_POMCA|nr:hypothetical protein C0Q70_00569 [Pomacea canaliculata]